MIGPIKLAFILFGLLAWGALAYTFFHKRSENNIEIPLGIQLLLYLFSLVPLGLIVGFYLETRQRKTIEGKRYKYSRKVRRNATLIIIISIVSALLSLNNWTNI